MVCRRRSESIGDGLLGARLTRVGPAWRLRLLVYGLLAVGLVLALGARGWLPWRRGSLHEVVLGGRTEQGHRITMSFLSGRLNSFDTHVSLWCPHARKWQGWRWFPNPNVPHTTFRQDGEPFYVREVVTFPADVPYRLDSVMRGRVAEDGQSAKGTIFSHSVSGSGHDSLTCSETVSFSARGLRR
jgi:hypothetical protein